MAYLKDPPTPEEKAALDAFDYAQALPFISSRIRRHPDAPESKPGAIIEMLRPEQREALKHLTPNLLNSRRFEVWMLG